MRSRWADLQEKHRRILRWCLGVAVVIHVAIFAFWPAIRVRPLSDSGTEGTPEDGDGSGTPLYIEAVFGPPEILLSDGRFFRVDRELEASRVLRLPEECRVLEQVSSARPRGRVRLKVWPSGRADFTEVTESTGTACGDEVIATLADALEYRWLPNDRFPGPLEVIQPVTLLPATR